MSHDFGIGSDLWPGTSKLVEETGEMMQVAGKIMQMGENITHFDGSNLLERAVEELGDLQAAMWFFMQANGLNEDAIRARAEEKLKLFWQWHQERG